jgi:hypothetical protein
LVYDPGNARLTLLDTNGLALETTPVEQFDHARPWAFRLGGLLGDSAVVMIASSFSPQMRNPTETYLHHTPHVIYNREGSPLNSIGDGLRADAFGTPTFSGVVAYGRFSSADVYQGLLYEADGRPYEVRIHDPAGLRRILRLERLLRSPSPAEDEAQLQYMLDYYDDPERKQRARDMYEVLPRAETKPWLQQLLVGRNGRVWVKEWEPFWRDAESSWWGLFDVDGRWLGSLSLPPRFRLTDVEEDRILGVWRDELDVERVREYQLVGTAR